MARNCSRDPIALLLLSLALLGGCGDDSGPSDPDAGPAPGDDAGPPPVDAGPPAEVPLDPDSPWPKFRANPLQNGRVAVDPVDDGSEPWVFRTGKGIFSTAVIDADGNVYIGSADRSFYAIAPDGTERWSKLTGEIVDSSALLDDLGRVYFGSGDGHLYALDRDTGDEIWTFEADDPSVNGAFIRWFEGNVAMGEGGVLYAPNDNFCTYAIDRQTGEKRWCWKTSDQTWSLPAFNPVTRRLFIGNNFLLGQNVFAVDPEGGTRLWGRNTGGTVSASPMLTGTGPDDLAVLGSFDGFLYAYRQDTGELAWSFGARDHLYASVSQLSDGTLIQPAGDGTIYAFDPADGSVKWSFDTLEPIRSSAAIDGQDHIYVGSGEGRLFVLDPDGSLRWSIRLIDDQRNDLNASPALGHRGVVIAGEDGGVYFVPYDYCLRDGLADERCHTGGEALPDDGAFLFPTSRFGRPDAEMPETLDANEPLTLSLFVRDSGDTRLALLASESLVVTTEPEIAVRVDVSGDRKFLTVIPEDDWAGPEGGAVTLRVQGEYLVDLEREGLRFSGGTTGGALDESFAIVIAPREAAPLSLPIPSAPGEPAAVWEVYRFAAPLPTILPSYNQIGFDSIHYLIGLVEGTEDHAIAWGIGAVPAGEGGATIVDPASDVRFALVVTHRDGVLTMSNEDGFTIDFNGFPLPFESFRIAARIDPMGRALRSPAMHARTVCGEIDFYGAFVQRLGFCNPETDLLTAFGGAEMRPHDGGVHTPATGTGDVSVSLDGSLVAASFEGSSLMAADHNFGLLLVDEATGRPVVVDYVQGTERVATADGTVASVTLELGETPPSGAVRAYVMVDTGAVAVAPLTLP